MKPLNGIIHVTGEHDTGKTTFALGCGVPANKIAFFDDDVKGRTVARDLGEHLGRYVDLVKLGRGKSEIDFFTAVKEELDGIKQGQFEAVVFDTWTRFSKVMHAYVLRHPAEFRAQYAPMGQIKGAQQWQDTRRLEGEILNGLLEKVPLIILVTHLKNTITNGVKTGKQEPDASPVLEKVCRLRLWLRHNPTGSPVPAALVMKRMAQQVLTDEGHIKTVSVLPRKLVPSMEDDSLWDTINRYRETPVDKVAAPEEMPDEYEMSILDGTMTEDQKYIMREVLRLGLVGDEDGVEASVPDWLPPLVGLPAPVIVKKAKEAGVETTVPEVIQWVKEYREKMQSAG